MKKFSRIFFSLIITLFASSMVFSFIAIKTVAVEDGAGGVGGGGSDIKDGGPVDTGTIFLYKVTVYIDEDNVATKQSHQSVYEKKYVAYYGNNSVYQIKKSGYVGGKTKFEYVDNQNTLAAEKLSQFKLVVDNNRIKSVNVVTSDRMTEKQKKEVFEGAKSTISNCFAGDDKSKCFGFVREIAGYYGDVVEETDAWMLIVEPTISAGYYAYYYTPTEYAVALNCRGQTGYYDSFATNSNGLRAYGLSLLNSGNVSYITDGTWLGLSRNTTAYNTWGNIKKEDAFKKQLDNFIRYAGVFVWFSGAFENSDFTLPAASDYEKFENETITLSTNVNRTNPGKEGTVTVTLDYRAQNSQIIGNATQTVSFAKGEKSKSVSWQVQVGTYSNYSDYREMPYTIEIAPSGGTVDLNMDNNEVSGTIKLKRDLQVTSVKLNKNECFENENVAVTFSVKNANPYREYSKIPVTVYFVDALGTKTRIGEVTLETLGKGTTKNGSCTINVGCVTENADQIDYVIVTVNAYDTNATRGRVYSEPNMSNNKGSAKIKVKRDINLSVSIVEPKSEGYIGNAPSKVKNANSTQAVTSCVVTNRSRFNLYKGNKMKDTITVTFFVNNQKIGSQTVCVPKNGSNLVWFKWNVPESSSVTLRATVEWNVNQENSPSPYIDNEASMTKAIKPVAGCKTPDTLLQLEQGSNSNYFDANGYSRKKPSIAKWSQWICDEEGTFTRIDYALTGDASLSLIPDKKAEYSSGSTVLSGSGFSAVFSYTVRTECSENGYAVSGDDYTYAQNVIATFPEFQYIQTSKSSCRTMYLVKEDGNLGNSRFQFEKNLDRKEYEGKRIHFIPSNMPDGEYKVGVLASELWTPAGPIYVNATSSFVINGSVSNDWYVQ